MTLRNKKRAVAALAIAALTTMAASCWHPTFDPALSASELTIRKLGDPVLYFTVYGMQGYEMDAIWFAPQTLQSPSVGVLVQDLGTRIRLKGITIDAFNHSGFSNYYNEFDNTLGDAHLIQSDPNGGFGTLIITSASSGKYLDMTTWTTNPATMASTLGPFGIGAVALTGANQASLTGYTYPNVSDPQFSTVTWSSGAPDLSGTTSMLFASAPAVSSPGRFLSAGGFLYLSCGLADGSRAVYRWPDPPNTEPTRYDEDHGPLIGALSDGRLLAEEDDTITVLDSGLGELFSFPSGKLRFVHERFDGTTMKMVFTRSVFVRTSSHDDYGDLLVEIYEIPTANLSNLAD